MGKHAPAREVRRPLPRRYELTGQPLARALNGIISELLGRRKVIRAALNVCCPNCEHVTEHVLPNARIDDVWLKIEYEEMCV